MKTNSRKLLGRVPVSEEERIQYTKQFTEDGYDMTKYDVIKEMKNSGDDGFGWEYPEFYPKRKRTVAKKNKVFLPVTAKEKKYWTQQFRWDGKDMTKYEVVKEKKTFGSFSYNKFWPRKITQPTTPTVNTQPITPTVNPQPITPTVNPQPITPTVNPQPITPPVITQPITPPVIVRPETRTPPNVRNSPRIPPVMVRPTPTYKDAGATKNWKCWCYSNHKSQRVCPQV